MEADGIVIQPPGFHDATGVVEGTEQELVEAFVAQRPMKLSAKAFCAAACRFRRLSQHCCFLASAKTSRYGITYMGPSILFYKFLRADLPSFRNDVDQ